MKTNLEMLLWGINHIANNHGFEACATMEEIEYEGQVCILGCNVPTLADVQFLCDDVKLPRECIESSSFGIDVFVTEEWMTTSAKEEYNVEYEFWKKA